MEKGVYGTEVPDNQEFELSRSSWRESLGNDSRLRESAVQLQQVAETHNYTYHFEWCGVPIIRLPDDIMLLQEIVWHLKPSHIIECGVARGGGLILDASLMAMTGQKPRVLGLDIQILPHTWQAVAATDFADCITLVEVDSTSDTAVQTVSDFVEHSPSGTPGILILDSDHSHNHVLNELRKLGSLLRPESIIIVADTLIEELPSGTFANRPWDVGNNPMTAVFEFIDENPQFVQAEAWNRRGLLTEIRDGVLRKLTPTNENLT